VGHYGFDRRLSVYSAPEQVSALATSRQPQFQPAVRTVLKEYQLVYITKGEGFFESGSCRKQCVKAGTMILLFPDEWHSYYPCRETGWDEYWVGFKGIHIDNRVKKNFFIREEPLYKIGLSATIVSLYNRENETYNFHLFSYPSGKGL
jgi:hypothetical protein